MSNTVAASRQRSCTWVILPMLLALFGASCSLLSRIVQIDAGVSPLWTVVLGIATSCIIGLPFCSPSLHIPTKLALEAQGAVTFVVLGIVFARLVIGEAVEFTFIHILLSVGMCYQIVSWVLLTRNARNHGVTGPFSYALGLTLCAADAVLGELGARAVMEAPFGETLTWGMALLMLSTILLVVYAVVLGWPHQSDHSMSTERNDSGPLHENASLLATRYNLTERERDILTLLACDVSLKDIAKQTGISEGTVKTHLSHTYRKLGVANRKEASELIRAIGESDATDSAS